MADPVTSIVERLCKVGSPRDLEDWEGRDGYYVAACRVTADDIGSLIDIARKWSDLNWPTSEDLPDFDEEDTELLPVTAWRTLADMKADSAVQPLVEMLCEQDVEFDDWVSEELPHVFGKIGKSSIDALTHLAKDAQSHEYARAIAVCGLRRVADYHADTRDRIVAILTEMMAGASDNDVELNTMVMSELVDLQGVEAAEPIERAFAANRVDVGMLGDWEVVRRELGVPGLGLTMPENPYDSIEKFGAINVNGIFSDRPVFQQDDIDRDVEQAYYERADDAFAKSAEGQQVIDRYGGLGWSCSLLEYGLNHLGEIVDAMTLESVSDYVFDYVPRKVSTELDAAESIIFELALFWEFLDRVYQLPEANSIVEWLKEDGLAEELEEELSDASNFGMAKSMVMMGKNSGFDMTSEAGMSEFIMAYNQSLSSAKAPEAALPVAGSRRVGRNEPCPCGSGKKFKKCCR